MGFPGGSVGKESACSTGEPVSILDSGRSPGERNGNAFQYCCLENPTDREAWWATVHGVTRVGHGLVSKPQPQITILSKLKKKNSAPSSNTVNINMCSSLKSYLNLQ